MENFYIFLDIDGVLYDWVFVKQQIAMKKQKKGGIIKTFNPESISALNMLIFELEKKYNVNLVISSTWRHDLGYAINVLYANGLKHNKITSTPISSTPNKRALEILEYLNKKPDSKNIVIIDDEMFDYLTYFDKSQIIKTNIFNDCLNEHHIKTFLSKYNCKSCDQKV